MIIFLPFLLILCSVLHAKPEIPNSSRTQRHLHALSAHTKTLNDKDVLLRLSSTKLLSKTLKRAFLHNCHTNKGFIYRLFLKKEREKQRDIIISARQNTLEYTAPQAQRFLKGITAKQAFVSTVNKVFFPYTLASAENNTLLVTLNFADSQLFGFYKKGLLAQDELQVVEFPELALIREYLKRSSQPHLLKADSTSLIIHNIQRFCTFDTQKIINGRTLYGNNFQTASTDEISQALTVLQTPNLATILPIVAPNVSRQTTYKLNDIEFFLKNLLVGFEHARSFANSLGKSKLAIHTGGIGTGAFGNNNIVSIFLQLVAVQCVAGAQEETINPHPFCITFFHTQPDVLARAQGLLEELATNIAAHSAHSIHTVVTVILQLLTKHNLTPHHGTGE